jgi:hypothetical protein
MGISFNSAALQERLEDAVRLAESDASLPTTWLKRVAHVEQCPSETYIAAFGVALLAKATEPRVDVLTIKSSAGPNAYSMRGVARTLAGRARHYGYNLGVTGPEPLNNQPWFSHDRIDRIERIRPDVLPFWQALVRYLRDLQGLDEDDALEALAAFLRLRLEAGRAAAAARHTLIESAGAALEDVLSMAATFIRQDPEGGKRGQALVAAMLDCVQPLVKTGAINNPRSFDVESQTADGPVLAIEVKQKPVGAEQVLHLAESAAAAGIDKALYAALAADQAGLDHHDLRSRAASDHGVLLSVATSVDELAEVLFVGSSLTARSLAEMLPSRFQARQQELRVSEEGQGSWAGLFLLEPGDKR